uniref:Uncharacterized protein n=1 Tax=Arundo donax TaxID=35708 RepID=A0A0A9DF38_ARUDO
MGGEVTQGISPALHILMPDFYLPKGRCQMILMVVSLLVLWQLNISEFNHQTSLFILAVPWITIMAGRCTYDT